MAVSLPIPVLAPVITTVFPSSLTLLLHAAPFTNKTYTHKTHSLVGVAAHEGLTAALGE